MLPVVGQVYTPVRHLIKRQTGSFWLKKRVRASCFLAVDVVCLLLIRIKLRQVEGNCMIVVVIIHSPKTTLQANRSNRETRQMEVVRRLYGPVDVLQMRSRFAFTRYILTVVDVLEKHTSLFVATIARQQQAIVATMLWFFNSVIDVLCSCFAVE